MALTINHNMMAMTAARNLGTVYDRLSKSTQRLSSGLRINSAADDAAGLAIRELMRADIAVLNQGLRNAADAISLIQTAEGALSVIDEKLTRMKELAEQASTGTYTTAQREIMNSEYQAMAAEIDRIANATDFNGIKLLDGTVNQLHQGRGLKVHFGAGNDADEDYYFIGMGDARATEATGLQVGGDAKNDIWGQGAGGGDGGCCATGPTSLTDPYYEASGGFMYSYNYNLTEDTDVNLESPSYIAGFYEVSSGDSLQDLINSVNMGTQSRIQVNFGGGGDTSDLALGTSGALNICIGDETYQFISGGTAVGNTAGQEVFVGIDTNSDRDAASALATTINATADSNFWAIASAGSDSVWIFSKTGGDNDYLKGCDVVADNTTSANAASAATAASLVSWTNVETWETNSAGTTFGLGGEDWGTMIGVNNGGTWGVTLNGLDVGDERDLVITDFQSASNTDVYAALSADNYIPGMAPSSWTELQNAADAEWRGAEIRTQSAAQESLDAIQDAIVKKDKIRADLGALQNRLENTMTNISIQAENLQASESRISDVDVATEMTEFTRNNIMAQAATSMLAQANSLAQLALSLMG